jgi:hypothetical protein
MYFCQWSDPDLGSFSDDLLGCDTTLSMGFVYNANGIDATYRAYNLPPPSAGYDFLAGPLVASPGDSAVFDLKRRYDYRNLGMSSFAYFSAGSPYSDPPGGAGQYIVGTGRWWKMLRGFAPVGDINTGDSPYAFPIAASNYPMHGDPSQPGGPGNWIDGLGTAYSFAPGDRRLLVTTGPFSMAPGDTQEVYVGVVVGIGADRLTSVAVMKFNDQFVQNTFNALFQVPKSPVAPDVTVAELDGEIVLHWGSNLQRVADTETRVNAPGNYVFEGYNVYQLPNRGSQLSEGRRIITYDLTSDPTVILDQQFDQGSGQILSLPVQFGANSGIKRYFQLTRDYVRDIDKLYNGQEYYYVVTAYSRATVPGFLPAALESDPTVLVARPKAVFGKTYAAGHGDTLTVVQTSGVSDGGALPIVIDPAAANGNTYRITFADAGGGNTTWSLRNVTTGTDLLVGETNQTGDDNYKMVEGGIYLKVTGPPPGMKDWQIPSGQRRFTFADVGWGGLEGFDGSIGWDDPAHYFASTADRAVGAHELVNTLLRLAPATSTVATNPNAGNNPYGNWNVDDAGLHANYSYAYRYLRGATSAAARPEFAPFIVNAAAGYAYQDYKKGVPLSAWNVEANPPTRLAVAIHENNVAGGLVDGKWWPPANATGVTQSTTRDFLFILKTPYTDATPDPAYVGLNILAQPLPVMWWVASNRRGGNDFFDGDEFLILANHVNTPTTVFEYTVSSPAGGAALEKVSADKVGVFPNPYYAYNPAETSRFARFVTFNNLPPVAKIRIFNLAGQLVRTIDKNDASQFARWDLTNASTFPVASGMYIAHVEMKLPADGSTATKVLKFAVIQEQEILNSY